MVVYTLFQDITGTFLDDSLMDDKKLGFLQKMRAYGWLCFIDEAASFVEQQILASRADDDKRSNKRRKLIDGAVDASSHPAVDDANDGHVVLCRIVINLVS